MPQRCPDVFAWRRTFVSCDGPPSTTRLVLNGMSLFMAPGGGGCCWLSVRPLEEITDTDKGTVCKHRALAVARGWLIAQANPRHLQSPLFWSAVPDGIAIFQPGAGRRAQAARRGSVTGSQRLPHPLELSDVRIQSSSQSPSGGNVQSQRKLYGLRVKTVRSARTNCTSPPDQSYISINDLEKSASDALTISTSASGSEPADAEAARARLDAWIRSESFVRICHNSPGLLVKLTPPNCRTPGLRIPDPRGGREDEEVKQHRMESVSKTKGGGTSRAPRHCLHMGFQGT
jgi:hypothetical protein